MKKLVPIVLIAALTAGLEGCASSRGYEGAFSEKQEIPGNSHTFQAPPEQTFRAVTGTLVQKGFNIEQTDIAMGLIKATRNYNDPKDPDTNYHIRASAYVSAGSTEESRVTLSASQQTLLYRRGHSWTMLPLLPIIPIPTGRTFETVTTGEGGIAAGSFYTDFFAAVERTLAGNVQPATQASGQAQVASERAAPASHARVADK